MLNHLKKFDWIMISASVLLVLIGLVSIYSISLGTGDFSNFFKQISFFVIGIIVMVFFSLFDWRSIKENPYLILAIYLFCLLLLVGLFLFAPEIRGVQSWYKIGGISFDPIGLTVITLIVLLAKFFSMRHIEMYKLRHIFLSGIYVLIPFILIARQPDLGSALILISLWAGILIISGIKFRHLIALALIAVVIFSASWSLFLKDYQKDRILSFLTPDVETLGVNWSQTQSKIAIGSGGLWGNGFGNGSQTHLGFLSEPHTDFIFSVIAEEFGFFGISVVLILFGVLMWRILKISISSEYNFPRLFAFGFLVVIFTQLFIHIGMNLGLMPVIGLSLPFISYGGSGLVSFFIGLGILQGIRTH